MNKSKAFDAAIVWTSLITCILAIGMLANAMADFNQTMSETAGRQVTSSVQGK